jgi:hypothetical protein
MLVLLYHATTAVQMAGSVPEIMNTPSYMNVGVSVVKNIEYKN